jgi:glycosyltransferase involved in cell wall biosynthesis
MSSQPLISVIIPTYKRPKECLRAVRSVLIQTCQDFEIIVGDDFDGDETEALLVELGDSRVHYYKNGTAGGSACKNRNLCFERSRGEYITFLDSDDMMLPRKLELQSKMLDEASEDVGFVISGTRVVKVFKGQYYFDHDLVPSAEGDVSEAYFARKLCCYNTSMMVRREALVLVGGWHHQMEPFDDAELILRLMKQFQAKRLCDIVTVWFDHDGACLTNDLVGRQQGLVAFLTKYKEELSLHESWWRPRVNELVKLCYLVGQRDDAKVWLSQIERRSFLQTVLLFTSRNSLLFKLTSLLSQWLLAAKLAMPLKRKASMLNDLIPAEDSSLVGNII